MFRLGHNAINFGQPVNRSAPLNRGLVAWWLALPGRNTGSRYLDLCGNWHGTFAGDAAFTGYSPTIGQPVNFDGTGDYVDIDPNAIPLNSETTISFWFYPATSLTAYQCLVDGATRQLSVFLGDTSSHIYYGRATLNDTLFLPSAMTLSAWNKLDIVSSSSGSTPYLNGVAGTLNAYTSTAISSAPATWRFGANPSGGGASFNGKIAEVRLYSRALSSSEVWALYNASRTGYVYELNRISRPIGVKGAAGATFQAAWARRSNQVIGVTGAA